MRTTEGQGNPVSVRGLPPRPKPSRVLATVSLTTLSMIAASALCLHVSADAAKSRPAPDPDAIVRHQVARRDLEFLCSELDALTNECQDRRARSISISAANVSRLRMAAEHLRVIDDSGNAP